MNQTALDTLLRGERLLAGWARAVREERHVTIPEGGPATIAGWLTRHSQWLCRHRLQDFTIAYILEARRLQLHVRRVVRPRPARTIDCHARCPLEVAVPLPDGTVPIPDDAGHYQPGIETIECPGRLLATITEDVATWPDLVCDSNPDHSISPAIWRRWHYRTRVLDQIRLT